jgi:hypothetical protein
MAARTKSHTERFNEAWATHGEQAFVMRQIEATRDWREREHFHRYKAIKSGETLLNSDWDIESSLHKFNEAVLSTHKKDQDADWVVDVFTSSEPPKVLMLRYGISHSLVSLIRCGKRRVGLLRAAGLL